MTREESLWLVKSSGRILGPFRSSKIADMLRTREVSVLDEISQPMRRWQTIQYHEEFKPIVDGLRQASLSERTEASWSPGTGGLTQTLTDITDADLTEELSGDLTGFTNTAKEIVIDNVQESGRIQQPGASGRYQAVQPQNTAIQRRVEKTTRGLWILTLVVLLAVAGFILNKRYARSGTDGRSSTATLKQNVIADIQVGHYQEALKELKAAYPDPMQSGELAIYFGSLLIQVEGQTTVGRRLLNQVLAARRPEVKQAYTGLGVADLMDGQMDAAHENFERALSYDAGYVPALVNISALFIQKAEYGRAKVMAAKALKVSPLQGEALLSMAEAQLFLFKANKNTKDLDQVASSLREFLSRQWDYTPEIGFYSLYFDFLRQDRGMEEKLQAYLDRDPQLTLDHRHNVFIYRGRTQWKVLARLCEQMAEKLGESARVATFLASCHAQEGRWDSARRDIERAVHQSPKDPLIQAWYSLVLRESGDVDQASVVLGRASEFNRRGEHLLPILLQARFCQQNGDVSCARNSWQRIYENNLDYLPALSGLAWVHVQNKSFSEAVKMIDKGLRVSPDYSPLLVLRQRAEREGWYAAN